MSTTEPVTDSVNYYGIVRYRREGIDGWLQYARSGYASRESAERALKSFMAPDHMGDRLRQDPEIAEVECVVEVVTKRTEEFKVETEVQS